MVTWNRHAPTEWQARFQLLIPSVHTYVASSQEIEHELRALGLRNVMRLGDCVDASRFRGKNFRPAAKPTVGWCGNPKALEWMGLVDLKGLSVVESLRGSSEVTLKIASDLPPEQMPQWYRSVDIYVCASRSEGTPLPVLEAMATGNIVVSTAVGIVPELRSPGLFRFDGTRLGLHAVTTTVIRMRSQWAQFGAMNRQCIIERWSSTATATALSAWLTSARPLSEEVQRAGC
jgi:glycosyltransferase involved in cell wall biosynthesis